ncbi:ATP-binding cassette domain-containing protein, partial [uncultured Helcococcus sp.]|uniref:ATP-binding cassette domain-containing protein n=1 Tax=uncultured Helcococcus sp. TaxID=1072508 RepID=UPI002627C972
MKNIMTLKNISKRFGENIIFDKFNLDIEEGKSIAIVGKSGSGKSTLLNIISLIEPIDEGEIIFENKDISNLTNN